jgi:uncharacterized membrane protein
MNFACSAAIGAVSGLRSFTGPAIISQAAGHRLVDVKKGPLSWLASPRTGQITALLAAGELIADKLPFMPNRTDTPALIARFLAGAVCGAAVAPTRKTNHRLAGALIGGAAAVGAAYAGLQYRKHVKLPKLAAALIEDTVAVGLGTAVAVRACA